MKIRKAIFPAAGFGTRFLPVTKSQPKEMLPIVDKPVIQYLVEEAVASGIEEIIIVTGRGKRAIEDHFDFSYELEQTLVERGKRSLLAEVRKIPQMAKFVYVRQPFPLGDGDAIFQAAELIGDEPCAVMFGDDLVDSKVPALKQLISIYEKYGAPVVALQRVEKKEVERYGIVECLPASKKSTANSRLHHIKSLVEKPTPAKAPSNLAVIGKYIITPEIMQALQKVKKGRDGEIRLIDALKLIAGEHELLGYEIEGTRYDTGDKLGFLKATIDYALKRKDLGPELRKHLKNL
ncbi:UTP--glucose-1-phosphate uridylyltransferase [Candidatus Peregrinibacteria bacterium CG11_big_fil_rev_8_21_14_0_20_46_8]|nr:MAG: UTP--glucose-1-phosphate uridylyltransferase [Candidatus Peregrinibacteria bacterium CG11_big_fil_rev_8_21_14_0_20_46_8]